MLGAMSCLVLAWQLPRSSWIRFGVWLVVGLVVYGAYGLRHSRLRGARSGSE